MVQNFQVFFSEVLDKFTDFLISLSYPLQLLFRITMPTIPKKYGNQGHGKKHAY